MLRLLVSVMAVALIQVLTAMGLLLQWAPAIVRLLWRIGVIVITLSCVGYRSLVTWPVERLGWWVLTRQPWRTFISVSLSLSLACAICFLSMWPITEQVVAIAAIHGLIVGFAWDDLGRPRGQSLGR